MEGMFYKPVEEYNQKLDPIRDYIEQVSTALHIKTGMPMEKAIYIVKKDVRKKFKDPEVEFFFRQENGDRVVKRSGLYTYIRANMKVGNIISPSFTVYKSSKEEMSWLADYSDDNALIRGVAKKEAQAARARQDTEIFIAKNGEQNNRKIKNNAVSGLMILMSSVINNPSGHSTLTSATRTITSLSNSINERFVGGNRALFTPMDVLRSIVNEVTYEVQEDIQQAINEFNLYVPTVDDVVDVLRRSGNVYSRDFGYYKKYIIPFLECLNGAQRAGICYTLDLYHLTKFNFNFMKQFFTELCFKVTGATTDLEDPDIIYQIPEAIRFFAHGIMYSELMGRGKDYKKMNHDGLLHNLYLTCLNVQGMFIKYSSIIKAFMCVEVAPINSNKLEGMRRRPVVLSDTDSSAFSTDKFIEMMFGKFKINPVTIAVSSSITYMASESIVHQLSRISSYMNVEKKNLRRLKMKNEYFWFIFVPTFVSKHYFSDTAMCEGDVFIEPEDEIKGVHLKNSAVPDEIIEAGDNIMKYVMRGYNTEDGVSLAIAMGMAIDIENKIIKSIMMGGADYLKRVTINEPSSYANGADTPIYKNHVFYKEVLEAKYGSIQDPPYAAIKIPIEFKNKTALATWVDSIKDISMKKRLESWLVRNKKTSLNNIYLSSEFVMGNGIPEEFIEFLDLTKIVLDMTKQIRLLMSTLGIVIIDDILLKDQFIV